MEKLIFGTFLAMAIAMAVTQTADVRLLSRVDYNDGFGNFRSYYELSDGTVVEQRGAFRDAGTPDEEFVISGFYYYIAPNGEAQLTEYVADKNGDHKKTTSGLGVVPPRKSGLPTRTFGISSRVAASLIG